MVSRVLAVDGTARGLREQRGGSLVRVTARARAGPQASRALRPTATPSVAPHRPPGVSPVRDAARACVRVPARRAPPLAAGGLARCTATVARRVSFVRVAARSESPRERAPAP